MNRFKIAEANENYVFYINVKKELPPDVSKHLYRCSEILAEHFGKKTNTTTNIVLTRASQ